MQQRRRLTSAPTKPVTATVLATALVASAAVGIGSQSILKTQDTSIEPVTASVQTDSLAGGKNVVINDAAIASQSEGAGPRTVKEFTRDQEFSQFALTWTGDKDIATFVRGERPDGSWTEWFSAEPISVDSDDPNLKRGTDLIYIEPTKKVQVSVAGIDLVGDDSPAPVSTAPGAATPEQADEAAAADPQSSQPKIAERASAPAPKEPKPAGALPSNFGDIQPVADAQDAPNTASPASDFDVVFIDGGEGAPAAPDINLASDSDGMPRVISRAGWGANESLRCGRQPDYLSPTSGITIHHTAGSNNYSEAEAPGVLRGIYQYHAQTLGWCDIGYHALADKYGNLYEGRYGGLNRDQVGAHAGGFNSNTWGISMMGNFDTMQPPSQMIQAVGELAGWRSKVANFDPTGSGVHYSEGSSYTNYPLGTAVRLPNIFAHRDVGNTSCPGQYGYAQMDTIRSIAKNKYNSILETYGESSATTTEQTPATTIEQAPATIIEQTQSTPDDVVLDNTAPSGNNAGADVTPALNLLSSLAGNNGAPAGADAASIATTLGVVGSLLALGIGLAADAGMLPGTTSQIGDVQVVDGLTLNQLIPMVKSATSLSADSEMSEGVNKLIDAVGPVLGENRTGVASYTNGNGEEVKFSLFDNGIVLNADSVGTRALWGAIADAWAAQGFDAGPLGLPVSEEFKAGPLIRVDFQGGYITFDPATGALDIGVK